MIESIAERAHFQVHRVREIPEMQGRLWEMEHPKSGAKLVWLDRPDENMTFAIGFRTIPTDSTGVFHILEHSVLGGSDLYPVKEPFVELLKSSLKTFLNALTFPDKTLYPVSSRNKQDFRNLIGVYMDAVLHPLAVHDPNVFRQEGWHLELNEEGKPVFQGVVYNEMKGAYSDVRSVLEHTMMAHLFPDTCYRHEAGGEPSHIPTLTYEHFVSEHAKYYHPSNAMILLDGQVDLDSTLTFLDSVLCVYDRQDMVFPIPVQKPIPYVEATIPYEIGAEEDPAGKAIISRGKLLCTYDDPETLFAAQILADYLSEGSEAPLKRAILDAGLGADLSVSIHDGMQQAWIGWKVWNTEAAKLDAVKVLVHRTLTEIADKGMDPERLLGCYNSLAFQLMDRDGKGFPRGLLEAMCILESWLYGGDPAQNLSYRSVLDGLKAKLNTGYFENLLRRTLLDNTRGVLIVMIPSKTLGEKRIHNERQRAEAYWNSLSEAEQKQVLADTEALKQWQQTPNSPEALATIPMLSLEDLKEDPKSLEMTAKVNAAGNPLLLHHTDSALAYLNLHFEASDLTAEEMPLLNLLGTLLGTLPTQIHNSRQLQTQIKQKVGELDFFAELYNLKVTQHRAIFTAHAVCLPAFAEDSAKLLNEILNETLFTDTKLLADILQQQKNNAQRSLISSGNRYAAGRVVARQTSVGAAREYLNGVEYIRWLSKQCALGEAGQAALLEKLQELSKKLFTLERLTVSLSDNAADLADSFCLPESGVQPPKCGQMPLLPPCREGILIPAAVGFASKGANLIPFGGSYSGHTHVMANLMKFQYLWNAIRVQGGAYGSGFLGSESGDILCFSFRDPTPGRSIDCFDQCASFAEEFLADHPDLTKFILGALSEADPLLTAERKIRIAESRYFKGTTQEDILRTFRELRSTTAEDLLAMCDGLRKVAEVNNYCIVGGKQQLDACADKLDTILDILA